jgi:hypothetical protein
MKKQLLLLLTFCISLAAVAQVSSTDGTFSAAGTTNLGLRTNTTTRLTILGSGASAGFVGVNTAAPADWFHVNGNVRANQFNSVSGILNTLGTVNLSFRTNNTARMTILGATSGSRLAGFVGLNTITPDDWFHVNGNIRANQFNSVSGILNAIGTANLSFRTNNTEQMTLKPDGNVGIGTTNPQNKLQIGANPSGWVGNDLVVANGNGALAINTDATNTYFWGLGDISIRPGNAGNPSVYAKSDGNVGIGTATPAYRLDVNGTLNATSILVNGQPISGGTSTWVSDGVNTYIPTGNIGIGTTTPDGFQVNLPIASEAAQASSNVRIGTMNGFPRIILDNAGSTPVSMDNVSGKFRIFHPGIERLIIDPTGNVGIGETAPQAKLHISAAAGEAGLYVGGNGSWINFTDGNNYFRNNTIFADTNVDHKVGIGTTTPAHKLDVNGVIGINGKPVINTMGAGGDDLYINSRVIRNESATNLDGMFINYNSSGAEGAHLRFYANGDTERMRIDASSGSVGIGTPTPNPAYKLDVAGTINATSILVGGQPISSGSSSWANIGTDINFLTGNVGIGRAPATGNKLDVDGAINSSSFFLNGNSAGQGDPTFTTRSTGTKLVLNPSLAAAAADYAFGTSANTLWSSVNTTNSSFKWFGGNTLAATLTGGGNLTLGGSGSIKARNVIPSSINLTTAGATTILNSASHYYQNSTVAQTIKLPVVTTLSNGHQFFIKNSSTQPVTVQTSAGTALQVMAANATLELTCINTAGGTGTASWQWVYNTNTAGGSGSSSQWVTTGSNIAYNTGNVGIGITPAMKLHLATASALDGIAMNHSNGAWANFYSPSMTGGAFNGITQPGDAGLIFGTHSGVNTVSNGFVIAPHRDGVSGLRINNNGNVGIGGSLSVSADFATNGNIEVGRGDNLDTKLRFHNHNQAWYSMGIDMSDAGKFKINSGGNIGDVAHFTMDGNGNVGIGTTAPNSKLVIYNGSDGISFNPGVASGIGFNRNVSDGAIFNPSISAWQFSSRDDRFTLEGYNGPPNSLFTVLKSGFVGIGTNSPDAKLAVKGQVHAQEVKVDLSVPGPDYVFEKEYNLPTLDSIKAYIDKNKHLPEVPSAKEMEKNGVNLGEMNMLLLKKIEELTLHLIAQEEEIKKLRQSGVGSDLEKKLIEFSNYFIKQESRIKELELKIK